MSVKNKGARSFSFLTDEEGDAENVPTGGGLSEAKNSPGLQFEYDETKPVPFLEGRAEQKKVVIALDFGSTHSGFAYAMTDKRVIISERRQNGLFKEPTCALFETSGELISFGLKARDDYMKMLAEGRMLSFSTSSVKNYSQNCLYFDYDKLKMRLYAGAKKRENLDALMAMSSNGTEVQLKPLVAAILAKLRENAIKAVEESENIENLKDSEILWILTVPAIWLEVDKQFMREAAVEAKIISDENSLDLILALEPECAAIRMYALKDITLQEDDKLLILDCGGGTVDCCAIQVSSAPDNRFRFRQLLEATGGNWGATYIDDNFYTFMKKLVGKDHFHRAMLVSSAQVDIRVRWEKIKLSLKARDFEDTAKGKVFDLKNLLIETRQNLGNIVKKYNSVHRHQVNFKKQQFAKSTKLILTPQILRTFFDPVIRKIVAHANRLVQREELKGLKHIVLVGGLGHCKYLNSQLMKKLKLNEITIVVPYESSSVVMKGAVEFGLQPSVIETRKCSLTVGIKGVLPYDEMKHTGPEYERHKKYDKKAMKHTLRDVFVPLVKRGQEVQVNEEVVQHFEASPKMQSIKFEIYASRRTDVQFVTSEFCLKLGTLIIPVDQTINKKQRFKVTLYIGFTELFAKVTNETTNKSSSMRLEFNKTGDNAIIVDHATPTEI